MPRAYTEQEAAAIRQRLLEVGERRLARFGLRKTTIEEIVRDARIGKGTFYQHFESKEDLFLTIQEEIEARLASRMRVLLARLEQDPREMVRTFFTSAVSSLREHPFLRQLLEPDTLPALLRNAPSERVRAIERQNQALYHGLFTSWIERGVVRGIDADTLFGLLATLFLLEQNREALGGMVEPTVSWIIERISDCAVAPPSSTKGES